MSETPTEKQTIVENGTEFDGVIRSQCPIVIRGQMTGEVWAPTLTVTAEGRVDAKVKVSLLKAEGWLAGDIEAESIELSGNIRDDTVIRATALEVKLNRTGGRQLQASFGNCELNVGGPEPDCTAEIFRERHLHDEPLLQHSVLQMS